MATAADTAATTLSIVSHGQGDLVRKLLGDLRGAQVERLRIILTLNVPEDEDFLAAFGDLPMHVVRNPVPRGFGANHNAAFELCNTEYFAVVNPDIRLEELRLEPLLETLESSRTGVCGPVVLSSTGNVEDSARRYPTFTRLAARVLFGRKPDYRWSNTAVEVDWLAGMFLLFRSEAFRAVNGFDERFFMYFEDADICRRLRLLGWSVRLDPRLSVIHDAQRRSHRDLRHLQWHLTSALRYLYGSALKPKVAASIESAGK